jgi:Family of unknown function (DUF6328)
VGESRLYFDSLSEFLRSRSNGIGKYDLLGPRIWHLDCSILGQALREMRKASKSEELSLDSAASHLLEECRMVLPGIQALFGFQLIAVFNQNFGESLSRGEQKLHFVAIVLVVISIALVMAPAAIHRLRDPFTISNNFVSLASRLLLFSMAPLAISLCLDVYLVGRVIFEWVKLAVGVSSFLLFLFFSLWLVLPKAGGKLRKF